MLSRSRSAYNQTSVDMGKTNYKLHQIVAFDDFCKAKNKKQIEENNEVSIDVPFWDDAVSPNGPIFSDLHSVAENPINWNGLIKFIKVKNSVIDRNGIVGDENLVIAHLRDLLFQHYGDSFLDGEIGCLTYDSAEIGAKSLVISQLASEILHRIRVEAGLDNEPEPTTQPEPVVRVSLDSYDYYDDLPFERKRATNVEGYKRFCTKLNESVRDLRLEIEDKCLDYCLNKIEKDCGSVKYDDVAKVVKEEQTTLVDYIKDFAEDYFSKEDITINGRKIEKDHILKQARKLFVEQTTEEIIKTISMETIKK